ncbi:MAG: AarF/ABC1/UbiB kinase family protein [Polyangiaceae bacterium]|nr:AarF/ABC1/UbiB kinase family protein [Polyangiaceae bacterium]
MADDKPKDKPPTSRLGRLARLAALAPRGVPIALAGAKRALGMKKADEPLSADEKKKISNDAKKAAEALLKTLGEMKGLPLKVGQMVSYIDGLAPPGYEERFKAELKKLLDKAPPLSAEAAVTVVKEELGAPPEQVFAGWEREPFAAASIGQVHHATTKGGDEVAVKVQYPGIDKAIEADLKSIQFFQSMMSPIAKKLHSEQTVEEIAKVFREELDYGLEAERTDTFRRIHEGDERIIIPRVHHSLTTRRVLTTDLVAGRSYAEFCKDATQEQRNQAGVAIWTFTFRSLLKYGHLYADPHPGNYRFYDDGRVAFLDFGCVKVLPPELVSGMKRYMRAAMDEDWHEFDRACVEVLGYDPEDESWELYRGYTLELLMPIMTNDEWVCSHEKARETVAYLSRGLRKIVFKEGEVPHLPKVPKMPQDFTFVNRLQWGLASVMAGLGTIARFRPIVEPWIRGPLEPVPGR